MEACISIDERGKKGSRRSARAHLPFQLLTRNDSNPRSISRRSWRTGMSFISSFQPQQRHGKWRKVQHLKCCRDWLMAAFIPLGNASISARGAVFPGSAPSPAAKISGQSCNLHSTRPCEICACEGRALHYKYLLLLQHTTSAAQPSPPWVQLLLRPVNIC